MRMRHDLQDLVLSRDSCHNSLLAFVLGTDGTDLHRMRVILSFSPSQIMEGQARSSSAFSGECKVPLWASARHTCVPRCFGVAYVVACVGTG